MNHFLAARKGGPLTSKGSRGGEDKFLPIQGAEGELDE